MRTFTRFHVLVFSAVCSIVYVGWVLPSLQVRGRVQKAFAGSQRRIVVFGDSWSDTGEYRIDIPPESPQATLSRPLWTEALCKEVGSAVTTPPACTSLTSQLLCDEIDNFARSSGASSFKEHPDAVLDTDILANVTQRLPEDSAFLAELKTQVHQWIAFE